MTNENELQPAIERIKEMEEKFERLFHVFEAEPDILRNRKDLQNDAEMLSDYLNGKWLQDHELDEKHLLPDRLNRGILSEDGLYNLLCDIKQWAEYENE